MTTAGFLLCGSWRHMRGHEGRWSLGAGGSVRIGAMILGDVEHHGVAEDLRECQAFDIGFGFGFAGGVSAWM